MKLQWLGTAGFRLASQDSVILLDPYLSRNPNARPVQPLAPETFAPGGLGPVSQILISHGHFDHLMDVPAIARATGARVVCSPQAARTLVKLGTEPAAIRRVEKNGQAFALGSFTARAFFSTHVRFDFRLVARTLARLGREVVRIFPLFRDYPCGQVLSWRVEAQGRGVHFFGSAGPSPRELARLREAGPLDLLLVPLQGHSDICQIGLSLVRQLEPALVIPHHHDDFYPPLSRAVDIRPFIRGIRQMPGVRLKVPELNREFCPWD